MVAVINGPLSPTAVISVSSGSSQSTDVSSSASSHARLLLLRLVHSAYRRWAYFIVAHAWAVILLCTLLCVLCTFKLATTPQVNDITGYTPYGARSRKELALRDQFFDSQGLGQPFGVFLLLLPRSPKENGNFMIAEMLAEAAKVDELVRHNFPLPNRATNRNETFVQFCRFFCDINEPLRRFEEGFRFQSAQQTVNQTTNPAIQLDYPVSTILGRKFNIQPNFFGIHFANSSSVAFPFSNMARVDMLALHYKAERIGHWSDEEVKRWEMAVSAHFEHQFESSLIRVLTASNTYVEMEVVRAGLSMLPFLIVGFTIMFCCTSVFVLLSAAYMGQLNAKKLWLALMACVCPFMATGTALGLLFLCGVRFGSVLCVTPFLVLAIGVDDAYLMIHAWQRVGSEQCWASGRAFGNGEMRQRTAVAERLALVLVDTGPAILISALTNICADAVGSLTGSPEITLLCVGNMAAIAVDFFFQVTFYAAVMVLVSQSELKAGKQFRVRIPVGWTAEDEEKPAANVANGSGSLRVVEVIRGGGKLSTAGRRRDRVKRQLNRLVDGYVRLITWPWAALGICLLWLAFLGFSAINVTKFEVNLSTKKLFASDSPLLEVDGYRERQIVPFFTMATIFVNSPGNLSDPARLHRLDQLVEAMENLPGSWGPQSTNYLVRELAQFVGDEEEEGTSLMDHLEDFLQWPEHAFWRAFVRRDNGTGKVEALLFTTAYHGDQLKVWAERTRLLKRWRAVVDQFGELNASVFHDEGIFLDLIDNMPDDAWQSALATLLCMCLICALFMGHDWKTVLVAGAVISSIMVGTLGILAWIDRTSMDPIMMAALLISIGFSVDIPAHVSYHFHSSLFEPSAADDSHSVQRRFRQVLMSVGLPALQASFSTSLCVLALLFVPLYMATIFVRIMCTCILLCVLHSLLLMPALFALLDCARRRFGASSRRRGK